MRHHRATACQAKQSLFVCGGESRASAWSTHCLQQTLADCCTKDCDPASKAWRDFRSGDFSTCFGPPMVTIRSANRLLLSEKWCATHLRSCFRLVVQHSLLVQHWIQRSACCLAASRAAGQVREAEPVRLQRAGSDPPSGDGTNSCFCLLAWRDRSLRSGRPPGGARGVCGERRAEAGPALSEAANRCA